MKSRGEFRTGGGYRLKRHDEALRNHANDAVVSCTSSAVTAHLIRASTNPRRCQSIPVLRGDRSSADVADCAPQFFTTRLNRNIGGWVFGKSFAGDTALNSAVVQHGLFFARRFGFLKIDDRYHMRRSRLPAHEPCQRRRSNATRSPGLEHSAVAGTSWIGSL